MYIITISSISSDTGGTVQVVGSAEPIVALVGDDVILPCTLRPTVSAVYQTVEWQRPDLKPKEKTTIQLIVGESTHLLTTQSPLRDRSHEIKGAASRPVITIEGIKGDEVVLRCEAEGCYPEPVMEWCDVHGRVLPPADGPPETSRDREGCYTVTSHVNAPKNGQQHVHLSGSTAGDQNT
ncbi:hypothetical protein J4Q44_G00374230 [Coregonus suidteri]|uniref:Butyrophilin subfamily 3 member A2-like Ig-C domain-containing protein n=1 Tax=Coregonus suidteri TaxID=861788 RepID=A0AAN8KB66_9TELE